TSTGVTNGMSRQIEEARLALDNYVNDYKLSVIRELKSAELQLSELESQLQGLYVQLNQTIDQIEDSIFRLEEQDRSVGQLLNDQEVKAPIDGVINVLADIKIGDFVQPGMEILSIVPANNSEYTVQ